MGAPTVNDLSALLGRDDVNAEQATAVLGIVTAMASAYTRAVGFMAGVPNDDIRAVILTASARLLAEPSQIVAADEMGPFSVQYRAGFDVHGHEKVPICGQ
ncbi:hypothetical protein BBJ32_03840 [Mycobacterium avium]|nr:hypothetical protein BBJ32_03840 [Mycobacterium avium]